MTDDTAKAVARRWIVGLFDHGDAKLVDELAAPGYTYTGPDGTLGAEAFKEFLAVVRSAFPDIHNTIEDQVAEGSRVVTRGTTRMTHLGPFGAMAATGRPVVLPWVFITEFDGNLVAKDWEMFDVGSLMRQLGVVQGGDAAAYKELVRRWLEEGLNEGRLETIDELASPNYVYHGPFGDLQGPAAIKEMIVAFRAAFPDLKATLLRTVVEGDFVATHFVVTGTQRVEFLGVPPTGRQMSIPSLTISRLERRQIVEDWEVFDVAGLVRQLRGEPLGV